MPIEIVLLADMEVAMRCRTLFVLFLGVVALVAGGRGSMPQAQENRPPVAYTGHGAFFDGEGRQITPTESFIRGALDWYRRDVEPRVRPGKLRIYERQLAAARQAGERTVNQQLMLELRAVQWLLANARPAAADAKSRSVLNSLAYVLQFELPKNDKGLLDVYVRPVDLGEGFAKDLRKFGFDPGNSTVFSATINFGQDYNAECSSHGVPIPPPIGDPRWVSQGFIPTDQLFLVNTSVEVMTYRSTTPEGMCIALPRSNETSGNLVVLDGVICLGKKPSPISGKSTVCFWDNQMNGQSFSFTKGTKIPIGWNDPAQVSPNPSGRFMSGGAQLTSADAGMCTDCHAGQNPYVVHPRNPTPPRPTSDPQNPAAETVLGKLSQPPLNLPMFGDTWYDPIVLASWPQNAKRLNDVYLPQACEGCHSAGGSAGQLPHLSTELPGYCDRVLARAIQTALPHSMPQFTPGSAAGDADVKAIADLFASATNPTPFCAIGPTAGPADRGDPHLVTTNGVEYDFQAAGEFVALTDRAAGFELQTRQSPVMTTFTPGANAYTGLASCVSLNTAVALMMGDRRVTYQPAGEGRAGAMQLRIDGRPVRLARGSVALGGGNFIKANGSGSLTFGLADGTRVIATPRFWDSEGYWYIDVEVINATARAGIMGHIASGEWLPRGGDGSNFGPMPASLGDRFDALNVKFANSWRVTGATSLFDYASGQSTEDFTDRNWPSKQLDCRSSKLSGPVVREPIAADVAKRLCVRIKDRAAREQCTFDVQVMGDTGVLKAYLRTLKLRAAAEAALP